MGIAPVPLRLPGQQELQQEHWRRVNSSLNALSFGFLATAVLISVFLVVALLERFLHRNTPAHSPSSSDPLTSQASGEAFSTQHVGLLIPEKNCAMGVSVLMPGQDVPTFIANPVPMNHSHLADADDGDPSVHRTLKQDGH